MPTYKGNAGNLMQHWTLCKLLRIANEHVRGLNYIDAHAMAPWAAPPPTERHAKKRAKFEAVQKRVLGNGNLDSTYERAWCRLAAGKGEGYPNSAAFVRDIWEGDYSLLLCEIESVTAGEIAQWLTDVNAEPNCRRAELFPGDWRKRFETRLPNPSDVGLPAESLTLVSFDPDIISRSPSPRPWNGRYVYPSDLSTIVAALSRIRGGTLVQLSTYSNNGNSQKEVTSTADEVLESGGFTREARVQANGAMMSLVYARNIDWVTELSDLPSRFAEWLKGVAP